MPEVPDLEAIRAFFNARIVGEVVEKVDVLVPVVIRVPRDDFVRLLTGDRFGEVHRHGKFLLFPLASGRVLVINAMLTGRFAYVEPSVRRPARTCFSLSLANGRELRYADQRYMGRVYLVPQEEIESIPQFAEMGPDVLSAELSEALFRERIRRYTGQVKSILVNHKFIAGIGNAYADEILWEARIHPYRKRTQLSDDEVGALYRATRSVLAWAGRSWRRSSAKASTTRNGAITSASIGAAVSLALAVAASSARSRPASGSRASVAPVSPELLERIDSGLELARQDRFQDRQCIEEDGREGRVVDRPPEA